MATVGCYRVRYNRIQLVYSGACHTLRQLFQRLDFALVLRSIIQLDQNIAREQGLSIDVLQI